MNTVAEAPPQEDPLPTTAPLTLGRHGGWVPRASIVRKMEGIVLRVRLTSGDSMDVTYEEPDASSEDALIDHVVLTLSENSGLLRCRHGDRLLVLYGRGVAAVEVAPRGAVL
jgi:hypothetical protein